MKTVEKFLLENPSYVKCGASRISDRTGVSINTINRFRKTQAYKNIKIAYLSEL